MNDMVWKRLNVQMNGSEGDEGGGWGEKEGGGEEKEERMVME